MHLATPPTAVSSLDVPRPRGEHASAVTTIRYVLADNDPLTRRGIEAELQQDVRLQLVGTCSDTDTLGELVDTLQPAVVVTDACLPPDDDGGLAFVRGLRDVVPRIGVVVLSRSVDPTYGAALFENGSEARAYLLKGRGRVAEPGWLGDAISEVAAGRSVVDPKLVDGLFSARRRPASPVELLTAREHEVLALIATGMSNGAIAAELWLSKRAVEKYVNSIFATLGLRDDTLTARRVAAALAFLEASDAAAGGRRLRQMPSMQMA